MLEYKRPKISKIMEEITIALDKGRYIRTDHASLRMRQRLVPLPDVLNALRLGWHEPKRDVFDDKFRSWKYSVRGKSVNGNPLRIIVSFDDSDMLIITVIRLER